MLILVYITSQSSFAPWLLPVVVWFIVNASVPNTLLKLRGKILVKGSDHATLHTMKTQLSLCCCRREMLSAPAALGGLSSDSELDEEDRAESNNPREQADFRTSTSSDSSHEDEDTGTTYVLIKSG